MAKNVAIVLSGGRGSRMQSDIPKQYMLIAEYPVIYYSLKQFEKSELIDEIVLVSIPDDIEYCKKEIVDKYGLSKVKNIIAGGRERYESVYNGLKYASDSDYVFIHDGARPCINEDVILQLHNDVVKYKSAVLAVPSKDTVKIADAKGYVTNTPDRQNVWIIQTPQVFMTSELIAAYTAMMKDENKTFVTDDSMVMEQYSSHKVHLTKGEYTNIKVTTPEDIGLVETFLKKI